MNIIFIIKQIKFLNIFSTYIKKMFNAFITELIGTFVFLSVILGTGQPIAIAVSLAAVIFFGGNISGGHFNPAVSTMFLAKGAISANQWVAYVVAQVLGGLLALWWVTANAVKGKK